MFFGCQVFCVFTKVKVLEHQAIVRNYSKKPKHPNIGHNRYLNFKVYRKEEVSNDQNMKIRFICKLNRCWHPSKEDLWS